jgi:predicted ATP-dependent protease
MIELNELVQLRIQASSKYIANKIENKDRRDDFLFVISNIQNILRTCKFEESFIRAKKMMVKLEEQLDEIRYQQSDLSAFFSPRYKYDNMAFDLAREAIDKIETKFIKGYSE